MPGRPRLTEKTPRFFLDIFTVVDYNWNYLFFNGKLVKERRITFQQV
jgi:hypothetical protein